VIPNFGGNKAEGRRQRAEGKEQSYKVEGLVATFLRARGLDVLTTIEAEMTGYSDE